MPRKIELTWFPARNCWKKKHGGKVYYLKGGKGLGRSSAVGYAEALGEWQAIKAELDQLEQPEVIRQQMEQIAGVPVSMEKSKVYLRAMNEIAERKKPTVKNDETLGNLVKLFLDFHLTEVKNGNKSASRVNGLRVSLDRFLEVFGRDTSIRDFNKQSVIKFYNYIQERISKKTLTRWGGSDYTRNIRQFLTFVSENILEDWKPPVNYKSDIFNVEPPANIVIETFTIEQIQELFKLGERWELYFLLMLNCGMTQIDIAQLKHSEVNFKSGTITRVRSKRQHDEKAQTVCYKLWERTLTLLNKFKDNKSDYVLTSENGTPLYKSEINSNDKLNKSDCIGRNYNRLNLADRKPLKLFRKTGATILNQEYPQFVELYLGHSSATMADKHYANYSQDNFDIAIEWLGKKLGVVTK